MDSNIKSLAVTGCQSQISAGFFTIWRLVVESGEMWFAQYR